MQSTFIGDVVGDVPEDEDSVKTGTGENTINDWIWTSLTI